MNILCGGMYNFPISDLASASKYKTVEDESAKLVENLRIRIINMRNSEA